MIFKKLSHSGLDWFSSFAPLRMGAFCVVMGPFNKSHIAGPFSSPLLSGFCGALCVFCYLLGCMCLPFYFTLFSFSSCLFYVRHFWRIISNWVHALHYCCGGIVCSDTAWDQTQSVLHCRTGVFVYSFNIRVFVYTLLEF